MGRTLVSNLTLGHPKIQACQLISFIMYMHYSHVIVLIQKPIHETGFTLNYELRTEANKIHDSVQFSYLQ
jgi:hypothetical protein